MNSSSPSRSATQRLFGLLIVSTALLMQGCGGASSGVSDTTNYSRITATQLSADHGMGTLEDIQLGAIGSDLYALVTHLSNNQYQLQLYKSSDGGQSWQAQQGSSSVPPFASLTGYAMVSTGNALYMSGGRTSDATVTSYADYTFNDKVYKYTPNTGSWSLATSQSIYRDDSDGDPGGRQYAAMAADANGLLYIYGGYRVSAALGQSTKLGATYSDLYTGYDQGLNWVYSNSNYSTDGTSIPLQRHCMASISGQHFLVGGMYISTGAVHTNVKSISIYNAGSWNKAVRDSGFIDHPLHPTCTSSGNRLVVIGGTNVETIYAQGNAASNQGHILAVDSKGDVGLNDSGAIRNFTGRYRHGAAFLNGKIIVVGGLSANRSPLTDVVALTLP